MSGRPCAALFGLLALWATVQGQCDVDTCSDPAELPEGDPEGDPDLELSNLQLLQVAGPVLKPRSDWNFTQVMQDVPKGSFLSKLDVLVRMIGITYNTTSPLGKAPPLNVTTREAWRQLKGIKDDSYSQKDDT